MLCFCTQTFAAIYHASPEQMTIQQAIDLAESGDTVIVADGIYKGEGNVNIDFKGKLITVKSQNGAESTTVDCEKNPDTRGFIFQNNETNDSVLDGITIINGIHGLGGGIHCNNASPTIKDCVIDSNQAVTDEYHGQGGGGIYCLNSEAIITECIITNNIANSSFGGGVLIDGSAEKDNDVSGKTSLINCTISHNNGSGIFCLDGANPVIEECNVSHNKGRGIVYNLVVRSNIPITNCVIEHNMGGGIECSEYSILLIEKSIIKHNTARRGGGIYCSSSGTVDVSYCVIANNVATLTGGGIDYIGKWGSAKIENCTITQNIANESGGGIYVQSETSFSLIGSIVWGNVADDTHPEAYIQQMFIGNITVFSCNIKGRIEDIVNISDSDHVIISNNIHDDPLFVDADSGDYRLRHNSPALALGAHSTFDRIVSVSSVGKKVVMWVDLKRNR